MFKEHNWIRGGVHDIQYLQQVIDQPIFYGANAEGKGAKKGDLLMKTPGKACFTAIVEIKKSITSLLK